MTLLAWVLLCGLCFGGIPQASEQQPDAQIHKYTWAGAGKTGKKGALSVSFTRYNAEDGVVVEQVVEQYRSEGEATAALNSLLKSAARVLLRPPQGTGNADTRKGRVELAFDRNGKEHAETMIAWLNGAKLCSLRSESLRDVEDFEEQVYLLIKK